MVAADLPHHSSPFVGRGDDLAQIAALLANPACRLLTLTGPGGIGKTRLAIECAARLSADFPDGVCFVPLQPLNSAESIVFALAERLKFALTGQDTPEAQLCGYLEGQAALIVLDCFEHLLDGISLVSHILTCAPQVKLLITSREVLNIQVEWLYPVRGLNVPPSVYSPDVSEYEAVQLFVLHAHRVHQQFSLAQEREGVIRLCRLTEGLPLALELAAAWVKVLSAEQIAEEMQRSLDFLATHLRDVPERHRSLRAVFDHSWQHLTDEERQAFSRLSIFRGGFELQGAEAVAGAGLQLLLGLTDKSFLHQAAPGRFDIHELLRQYGAEQLVGLDSSSETQARHCDYYSSLMQRCQAAIKSAAQSKALQQIESDFDNIHAAWNWAAQQADTVLLNTMLESLFQFGLIRSRYRETADIFQRTLEQFDHLGGASVPLAGRLLARRWGYLHWWYPPDYEEALAGIERALHVALAQEEPFEIAFCQLMRGYVAISLQRIEEALSFLEQSRLGFQQLEEPYYESWALLRLATAHSYMAHREQVVAYTENSLTLARAGHNQYVITNCLYNLGTKELLTGQFDAARRYFEEAREVAHQVRHRGQIAYCTSLLALVAFCQQDYEQAARLADEGQRLGREGNIDGFQAHPLSVMIVLACLREDYVEARRLDRLGQPHRTNDLGYRLIDWALATLACSLGESETARHYVREALNMPGRLLTATTTEWIFPSAAWVLAETRPIQAVQVLAWLDAHARMNSGLDWVARWPAMGRLRAQLESQVEAGLFQSAWQQGTRLPFETVVTDLLAALQPAVQVTETSLALPELLTRRELEVLELMATGLTNPQIAARLVIGAGTVKTYTLNIYRKLDVNNRTRAIQRARELHLLST